MNWEWIGEREEELAGNNACHQLEHPNKYFDLTLVPQPKTTLKTCVATKGKTRWCLLSFIGQRCATRYISDSIKNHQLLNLCQDLHSSKNLYSMCLLRNEPHYSEFTTALKCSTFVSAAQMWVSVPGSECAIGLCLWVRAAQGNGCLWHAERGFVTGISEDEQDLQMKAQVRHDPHFHVLPSEPQSSAALEGQQMKHIVQHLSYLCGSRNSVCI